MIALFVLLYAVAIWLMYAKLRIKPNPINLAVCAAIGVLAVGGIVIGWRFSAPTSTQLVATRPTIQIVPQVQGPITKIVAEPNVPLKKGQDVLFEIQKDQYEFAVRLRKGELGIAQKAAAQAQAGLQTVEAAINQAEAELRAAQSEFAAKENVSQRSPGAVSELELTQLRETAAAAQAGVEQSKAARDEAAFALAAAQQQIPVAQANLEKAEFDLAQCVVYAPADGFVTNWQVREGAMAAPLPLAPLGAFIDTSHVDLIGVFNQNVLKYVKPGDKVEFALMNRPGQVFQGAVVSLIEATGEGQFIAAGQLQSAASIQSSGKFAVKLALDDAEAANALPLGTSGMAAIYTDSGAPFHIISKVAVRMKAWLYYLFPV